MTEGSDEVGRCPRCAWAWLLAFALSFAASGCAGKRAVSDLHQARRQVESYVDSGRYAADKSAADFKALERRKLTEEGFTILVSIGDQQSDLAGGYAERTFKLPNPVYFLP